MTVGYNFLFHAWLLFMMVGSVAGLFLGALLIMRPAVVATVSGYANNWIATRHLTGILERVIQLDRWLYRYHRVAGTFLLTGAIFLVYFFIVPFDKLRIVVGLVRIYAFPPVIAEILLDTAVLSILLGAVFVLIVSLFLLARPSMLRGFEEGANQWISLRQAIRPFEISRFSIDETVFQNIQMAGVLLLLGSLYSIVLLTAWL